MSKKITSFLVLLAVMLLTLPTHAQVQKAKRVTSDAKGVMEMRQLPQALKTNPAEMAQQKKLALTKAAEEAEANGYTLDQWDWAAHAPKPYVPQNGGQFVSLDVAGKITTAGVVRAKKSVPRRALVTPPAGVEAETWYTVGGIFKVYGSSSWVDYTSNMSTVKVIIDGTDIYLAGLSYWCPDAYIKGTISGTTATFASGQQIDDVDPEYIVGSETGEQVTENIVFTYDATEGTLTAVTPLVMGAIAPNSTSIYEYWQNPVFSKTEPEGPSMELIELPAGATTQDWFVTGTTNSGNVPATAKVAFVGEEVYVQGLFTQLPNAWVKGTKDGNSVAFPKLQYLGTYGQYNIWTWTGTIPTSTGYYLLDEVTFTYDEAAQTLTLDDNQAYVATADNTKWYALDYYTELMLSANEPKVEGVQVPYTSDLTNQAEFKKYKVLDNNKDGKTWGWSSTYGTYYGYSTSTGADDYLILPVELIAGMNYKVTVSAASYSDRYPEKFEVVVGKTATAAGLNMTAIGTTTVASNNAVEFEGDFTADETGVWYVAIHAISDRNMWNLYIKSLKIELGAEPTAPAAPVLAIEPGENGDLSASGTLTAPAKAINGDALTENIERIDILCDDAVLISYADVKPGAEKIILDKPQTRGWHTYQAVPYNASGIGAKSNKVRIWIGPDAPADVENVQVTGMPAADKLSMAWDEVKALNGGYLDPATVQYDVTTIEIMEIFGMQFPMEGETIGSVTGETAATVDYPVDEGEARYEYFGVKAKVEGDESDPCSWFAYALIGAPYELPIEEHFTNSTLHYIWDYNENTGLAVSQDGSDGDVALALTAYENGEATFETFKLDMAAAARPTMVFDAKKGTSATNKITVYAIAPDFTTTDIETVTLTNEYQTFKVAVPAELKNERWIRLGFKAELEAEANVLIDNIKVLDLYEYDLSIAVSAPKSVKAGETATITATVKNEGEFAASGYNVKITAGNEILMDEAVNSELLMFQTNVITVELKTTVFDDNADLNVVATVTYGNDLNPDNDTAETIISVQELTAPGVTNVTAWSNDDRIMTYWVAPVIDSTPAAEEVTEDFEEGNGGWTFIDADGDGFNWYYQFGAGEDGKKFTAHSGEGVVASESYHNDTYTALTPDNWLVSPNAILDGTFKFWAVGQDEDYCKEHFQVYVSTTSATDVSTFVPVSPEYVATAEYKEYTADLSSYAGQAGWIAIRHFNVTDEFVLVVDDITYLAGSGVMEIDHFNIYLDGEVATTAAANQSLTTIADVENGNHTVAVSVVYTNGQESKPVETTVHVSAATGIQNITVVTKPVDVYSVEGKLVRQQTTSLSGLKGVYIVDGKKVVIK
ncbi:MAG: choice-of-anchor J domain-containing protein [Prevotella sp.]|nr:choice-of-anchor J domain-containing protein [Prevotella sp.]